MKSFIAFMLVFALVGSALCSKKLPTKSASDSSSSSSSESSESSESSSSSSSESSDSSSSSSSDSSSSSSSDSSSESTEDIVALTNKVNELEAAIYIISAKLEQQPPEKAAAGAAKVEKLELIKDYLNKKMNALNKANDVAPTAV